MANSERGVNEIKVKESCEHPLGQYCQPELPDLWKSSADVLFLPISTPNGSHWEGGLG